MGSFTKEPSRGTRQSSATAISTPCPVDRSRQVPRIGCHAAPQGQAPGQRAQANVHSSERMRRTHAKDDGVTGITPSAPPELPDRSHCHSPTRAAFRPAHATDVASRGFVRARELRTGLARAKAQERASARIQQRAAAAATNGRLLPLAVRAGTLAYGPDAGGVAGVDAAGGEPNVGVLRYCAGTAHSVAA